MSASDNLNPDQLRMFIQAKELMDTPTREWLSEPFMPSRTMREDLGLYIGKLRESQTGSEHDVHTSKKRGGKSLHQSVKDEGVKHFVTLKQGKQTLINNGHHRIAAANDVNPDMFIPVRYE